MSKGSNKGEGNASRRYGRYRISRNGLTLYLEGGPYQVIKEATDYRNYNQRHNR